MIAAGLAASLILLDTTLWWIAAGRIEAAIPGLEDAADHAGWRIRGGDATRGGWPFAATIRVPAVQATRPLGTTTLQWTAASVAVTLSPWDPSAILIAASGAQTVSVGGTPIPVRAGLAHVRVPLAGGPAIIELRDLVLGRSGEAAVRVAHATGEIQALAAGFTADGVAINPALQSPFDGPLAVSGGLHLTAGFMNAATPEASARAWQQAGGRVEVPAMTLRWGPLTVSGSGAGGLDAQLQPEGHARLEITGAPQVLDAAGRAGLLAPGPEAAAQAVLGLLALGARGGPVPIQVTLVDRRLTVAQFPLLRLPLLDWNLP